MSLNFDYSKVINKDELFAYGPLDPDNPGAGHGYPAEAQNIVFACMSIDMGTITDKNYVEFAHRCQVASGFVEFPRSRDALLALTPEVVAKYIGLRTNVVARTPASWLKRQYDLSLRTAHWHEGERLRKMAEENVA